MQAFKRHLMAKHGDHLEFRYIPKGAGAWSVRQVIVKMPNQLPNGAMITGKFCYVVAISSAGCIRENMADFINNCLRYHDARFARRELELMRERAAGYGFRLP